MAARSEGTGSTIKGELTRMTSFAAKRGLRPAVMLFALAAMAALVAIGAPPAHAGAGVTCPDKFSVGKDGSIGAFKVPKGKYDIRVKRMTCDKAKSYFDVFLDQGSASKGWKLNARKGKFRNKGRGIAFRATYAKNQGGGGGGGGGGGSTCNFRVQNNDHIGRLNLPKGNYQLNAKRMPCIGDTTRGTASFYFRQFLSAPDNQLPNGWQLNVGKKKFRNARMNVAFTVQRVGS
jgi:hypothetical protein